MHICGREYPGPWETGISERAGRIQMSRRNLEGVTPAQVVLTWSQHQPCLQEGSQGSSEPTAHPTACESLRDTKPPGSHTQRGPRFCTTRSQTSPSQPRSQSNTLNGFKSPSSWATHKLGLTCGLTQTRPAGLVVIFPMCLSSLPLQLTRRRFIYLQDSLDVWPQMPGKDEVRGAQVVSSGILAFQEATRNSCVWLQGTSQLLDLGYS